MTARSRLIDRLSARIQVLKWLKVPLEELDPAALVELSVAGLQGAVKVMDPQREPEVVTLPDLQKRAVLEDMLSKSCSMQVSSLQVRHSGLPMSVCGQMLAVFRGGVGGQGRGVLEWPCTAGGGGVPPLDPPPLLPFQCLRLTSKSLLRCQEDLSFKIFGPPSAGTTGGPWKEGGPSQSPPPPSNASLWGGVLLWRVNHHAPEGRELVSHWRF